MLSASQGSVAFYVRAGLIGINPHVRLSSERKAQDRIRSKSEPFMSPLLVSTFLMQCIRNVTGIMALTIITLMLKKSVCIVRAQTICENENTANIEKDSSQNQIIRAINPAYPNSLKPSCLYAPQQIAQSPELCFWLSQRAR